MVIGAIDSEMIGPIIFFAEHNAGGGGLPLIRVCWMSARPFLKLAGPIGFENDLTDHSVSSETPVEANVVALE